MSKNQQEGLSGEYVIQRRSEEYAQKVAAMNARIDEALDKMERDEALRRLLWDTFGAKSYMVSGD